MRSTFSFRRAAPLSVVLAGFCVQSFSVGKETLPGDSSVSNSSSTAPSILSSTCSSSRCLTTSTVSAIALIRSSTTRSDSWEVLLASLTILSRSTSAHIVGLASFNESLSCRLLLCASTTTRINPSPGRPCTAWKSSRRRHALCLEASCTRITPPSQLIVAGSVLVRMAMISSLTCGSQALMAFRIDRMTVLIEVLSLAHIDSTSFLVNRPVGAVLFKTTSKLSCSLAGIPSGLSIGWLRIGANASIGMVNHFLIISSSEISPRLIPVRSLPCLSKVCSVVSRLSSEVHRPIQSISRLCTTLSTPTAANTFLGGKLLSR
mmetsp:Transcript_2818/g.6737  ORF Transcript_2818/g.6737 Transcript_2818/m.6737 type:complete len:319 (-) Transcript_2818:943-1899(-)